MRDGLPKGLALPWARVKAAGDAELDSQILDRNRSHPEINAESLNNSRKGQLQGREARRCG